jgi:response regulator of citrate/malate metabolism
MRVFLAAASPVVADQIKVGLAAFGDVQVDQESGVLALEKIRRANMDALIVVLDPNVPEHEDLLEKVRVELVGVDIIVIGHEALTAKLREEKVRGRVFALLKQPLEPVEFFRTISRLRQKRQLVRAR